MKKVGIITYHHDCNYGTVLQAYALQKAIDCIDDYQAEIIDYRAAEEKKLTRWQLIFIRIKRLPVYFLEWRRVRNLMKYEKVLNAKSTTFDSFFEKHHKESKKTFYSFSELKQFNHNYDILVTGSDQTWSPKIGLFPAFFLEFGPPKALRIAYAPSIGVSKLSEEEVLFFNDHLQSFEAISCRERLGTEILKAAVKGKLIHNVLDPTFLLTKEKWNEIAETPDINGDYIFCYFIGHKTYYRDIAQQLSKELELPLFFIPVSWQDVDKGYNLVAEAGPKEFLGLIRNARLVLTDSFHGTAFSINYRKTFYTFTKIEGGRGAMDNSRLYDILSKLHLEDRLYDTAGEIKFTDVDYSQAEKILEDERQQSLAFLKNALIDKRICPHEECTGCMACESVCIHKAIKIEKDAIGLHYPHKDMEKCVGCGLCEKSCPNNITPVYHKPLSSYVASAVSYDEQQTSTSGGLASVIARHIINIGGVVYGCTAEDARHIRHIRISSLKEVDLLKGSKYVQSDMTGIMRLVKEDLKHGLKVLFIGTPCQVAGLLTSLRKPYDNLITVDFVCHGVPSQQLLNDIVGHDYPSLEDKPLKINFRYKDEKGESHYGIRLISQDGDTVYQEDYPNNHYITGFLGGLYYRDSCYQCHYAKGERVSDITIGDYWDREQNYSDLHQGKDGLSMMMLNTQKGECIRAAITEMTRMQPVETDFLISRSGQLRNPMPKSIYYSDFKAEYISSGYSSKAEILIEKEINRVKKALIINTIAECVKKVKKLWQRK